MNLGNTFHRRVLYPRAQSACSSRPAAKPDRHNGPRFEIDLDTRDQHAPFLHRRCGHHITSSTSSVPKVCYPQPKFSRAHDPSLVELRPRHSRCRHSNH